MNEIKIEKIDDFKRFVDAMEVNIRYLLPDNLRYKWIKIEKDNEYYSKETYYSWAMEYNYKVAGTTGYIYPITGSNRVTHFKTQKGAKANFLKKYTYYFESIIKN